VSPGERSYTNPARDSNISSIVRRYLSKTDVARPMKNPAAAIHYFAYLAKRFIDQSRDFGNIDQITVP
jgi:hypothetical protein